MRKIVHRAINTRYDRNEKNTKNLKITDECVTENPLAKEKRCEEKRKT
jgi:hypothetical protein